MKRKTETQYLTLSGFFCPPIWLLLFYGCAQVVAPTGGGKDITPPEILNEEPANHTINFAAEKLIISFDEYIKLNQPNEQIVISPPMIKQPSYTLKKKTLVVTFEEELKANTTYTINFGEAIKDNNEGNILKNYTYVFSTGATLDSMEVNGIVVDAISGEAKENVLVMLYKNDIDSLPLDTIPDYFTRTATDGHFSIEHVANQAYRIFALNDQNSNYRFDIPDEEIAFLDTLILPTIGSNNEHDADHADSLAILLVDSLVVSQTADTLEQRADSATSAKGGGRRLEESAEENALFYELKMFVEEDTTQFLKRALSEHYGKLVFVYNLPVRRFSASVDGVRFKKQWALREYSAARDTLILWTTDVAPDTMRILSSVDGLATDTTELVMKLRTAKIEATKKGRGVRSKAATFALTLKTDPPNKRSPKPDAPLSLIWSHPILNMNLEKVTLMEDSIRVKYRLTTLDTALRKFNLHYNWKPEALYNLHIQDSAFTDLFNLWNDTIDISFTGIDSESFGELSLKITKEPTEQLVIELLNSAGNVLKSEVATSTEIIQFSQLNPGKYALRVITDRNKNGRWDSGRYAEHLQPEPINFLQKETEVRANWNMELEWNLNEEQGKGDPKTD